MSRRTHCTVIVALTLVGLTAVASAQSGPPILDDRDRATRIEPMPGALGPTVVKTNEPDPTEPVLADEESPTDMWVSLHSRWVSIPDFALSPFFQTFQPYDNIAVGLGVEFGTANDYLWVVELDWTPLIPKSGNWLADGDQPDDANYAESGLHMISIDVTYREFVPFTSNFAWFIGGGLGVGVLTGDVELSEVLPTCTEPVEDCAHWRESTTEPLALPTRVVPILHLTTGFQLLLGDSVTLRLETGFRDVFFAGLSVGASL